MTLLRISRFVLRSLSQTALFACLPLLLVLAGCGSGTSSNQAGLSAPTVTIAASSVGSLSVAGGSSLLTITATNATQVTVTGTDGSSYTLAPTGGTQTVTPAATTTYTAVALATGGAKATSTVTVTITAAAAPTVGITANPTSISTGGSSVLTVTAANATQLTVTGTDGSNYTVPAAGGTQTVSPLASTTYTAVAVGAGGAKVSATATVTLGPKTLTSIAITPLNPSISVGATQQFTATATYSDGTTANVTATVGWTAANAAVATVNSAGLAAGVGAGSTTVSASLSGVTGSDTLNVAAVQQKTLASIAVTPPNTSFSVGAAQQFTATATYSDGTTANVSTIASWTSTNAAVATVNSVGRATGVGAGSTNITASLSGVSGADTLTVTAAAKTVTSIAVTPAIGSVVMGSTQQFTATATYSDHTTADVSSSANWTAANTAVATVNPLGLVTGVASGSTTITAALSSMSGSVPLSVTVVENSAINIPTWHADNNRSGLNAGEQSLSPSNVSAQTFGKLFSYLMDGYVYGEPLLMSNITVNGSVHNVLYAATEHDSVYAFDADNYGNGTPLWQVSLLQSGETPLTAGAVLPYQGVTSTPVIDSASNTMYVVSAQTSSATGSTFRLSALDITTGAQKPGSPVTIQASVAGTNSAAVNGITSLTTSCVQRAALLLANGTVYIGFGGCHSGWLLGYNEQTLAQTGVFNASPNLNGEGPYASAGGIWMGSGGPAADSSGNIYVSTGNGPWDGQTSFGDSVLKFNSKLGLLDYFTPNDYAFMNCKDSDLAAGGLLLIPGTTQALAGGKTGKLYIVNTANLGHEQAGDAGATQTLWFEADLATPYSTSCTDPGTMDTHMSTVNSYSGFGTAAYFNGSVYLGITPTATGIPSGIRQFTYSTTSTTLTPSTYASQGIQKSSYGTTPFVSANGTTNGIVWMIDHGIPLQTSGATPTDATLRAYDVNNLATELYDSGMNSGDVAGYGIKFTSPIVGNGKVYISTGHDLSTTTNPQGELDVYGLK